MRHRTAAAVLAAALTITAAGCTAGGNTASPGAAQPPATLDVLAERIGCTGYEPDSVDMVPFASGYGTCEVAGGFVQLYAFPNEDAMAAFWDTVTSLGATRDSAATAGLLVAYTDDPAALEEIRAAL